MSQGIYKITNLVTGHAYIGKSVNIENRLKSHFSETKLFNKDGIEYYKALYIAIRKYGKDTFKSEVLELVEAVEDLNFREIYWIAFYNTYYDGYNMTPGGDGFHDNAGERHPNHKLTAADVKDIRIRYAAKNESILDIYFDYEEKIGYTGFKKIYTWQTWKNVLPELYTVDVRAFHKENAKMFYARKGEINPRAKITRSEVIDLRTRKMLGETSKELYKSSDRFLKLFPNFRSFCNLVSLSSKTWPDTWEEVHKNVFKLMGNT